jgi:hypothetical protein
VIFLIEKPENDIEKLICCQRGKQEVSFKGEVIEGKS